MQIEIQALGFTLTDGLRARAGRRLRLALGSVSGHVRGVTIRLADVNGPRGGMDKRCIIRARLETGHTVVIEQQDADLYAAIDQAAARLRRTVSRRLEKSLDSRRAPLQPANEPVETGTEGR